MGDLPEPRQREEQVPEHRDRSLHQKPASQASSQSGSEKEKVSTFMLHSIDAKWEKHSTPAASLRPMWHARRAGVYPSNNIPN